MLQHLRALSAAEGGAISIERFMEAALYHPLFGYYAAGRPGMVGRGGDFATSATLHPALGQALARWVVHRRNAVFGRGGGCCHLIELGGGSGELAAAILRALGWWERRGLRYHVVEISRGLRDEQKSRLTPWKKTVAWHDGVESALAAAGGRALIFSNEFVDAFPCVQLVRDRAARHGWREVQLAWTEESETPREILADLLPPRLLESGSTAEPPVALRSDAAAQTRDGQRIEIHLAYRDWLVRSLTPHWTAGRLLTIDYGDRFPAVYHRRPRGTLRAYFRHLRFDPGSPEVFARPGRQDLTADVNFSDLERWGHACGLETVAAAGDAQSPCGLSAFLRHWLPTRALRRADAEPALRFLLDAETGAGEAFRVLEQAR